MDLNGELVLEMVPTDVLVDFFHRKKTAISSQVDDTRVFLNQLHDHKLIPEDLCQKVKQAKDKNNKEKGMYEVLNHVENQGEQSIVQFWGCVFEDHMMKKYLFLHKLFTSLLKGSMKSRGELQLPAAKMKAEQTKCQNKKESGRSSQKTVALRPVKRKRRKRQNFRGLDCSKNVLPVVCGTKTGTLYRDKLAKVEQCILSEGRWFTPHEFERFSGRENCKNWKVSIRWGNTPLDKLIKKGKLLCPRTYRGYSHKKKPNNDVTVALCHVCHTEGNLVRCDECPRTFHHRCHLPTLQQATTQNKWQCTFCVVKTKPASWISKSLKDTLQSPVSGTVMRCEYLLLCLYQKDKKRVFTDDPTKKETRYSSVISRPMWLNRVKTKLQNKNYKTIGEFVCDIILIFKNCKKFYRDHEFGQMGETLIKSCVEEFHSIFKIQ